MVEIVELVSPAMDDRICLPIQLPRIFSLKLHTRCSDDFFMPRLRQAKCGGDADPKTGKGTGALWNGEKVNRRRRDVSYLQQMIDQGNDLLGVIALDRAIEARDNSRLVRKSQLEA